MLAQKNQSDKPTDGVRFLADAMLGKLAKWLRLLGYDTAYDPSWDDATIARLARAEGRVVLTRDRELARRRGLDLVLISADGLEEQMDEMRAALPLPPAEAGTRCCICNERLQAVDRQEVRDRVPAYVWQTQRVFHRCPICARIYWPGGHWARMQPIMSRLRGSNESVPRAHTTDGKTADDEPDR